MVAELHRRVQIKGVVGLTRKRQAQHRHQCQCHDENTHARSISESRYFDNGSAKSFKGPRLAKLGLGRLVDISLQVGERLAIVGVVFGELWISRCLHAPILKDRILALREFQKVEVPVVS